MNRYPLDPYGSTAKRHPYGQSFGYVVQGYRPGEQYGAFCRFPA
jgi:hypothetical protein